MHVVMLEKIVVIMLDMTFYALKYTTVLTASRGRLIHVTIPSLSLFKYIRKTADCCTIALQSGNAYGDGLRNGFWPHTRVLNT